MRNILTAFAFLLFAFLSQSPAFSDEASQKQAQETIQNQIEAFKSGDDAKAYSYAAPRVLQFFPDVMSFMEMVKKGYQPVYNPQNYNFGRAKELADGQLVQELLVTGPDGKPWTAIYTMLKMPNGDWRINGVQIVPGDDTSA
jgi:ABC-type transporter MlaC component